MSFFAKPKPFDVDALVASWKDAPRFEGKKKKDMPVEIWLDLIQAGCIERKVPEQYWHKVAQRYMGPKATARFEEFKQVLYVMKGDKYKWNWKKFRVAMGSLGWDISSKAKENFEVAAKPTGQWWVIGRKNSSKTDVATPEAAGKENASKLKSSGTIKGKPAASKELVVAEKKDGTAPPPRKPPMRAMSDTFVSAFKHTPTPPAPKRANTEIVPAPVVTTVANAPSWLVNASNALDFLSSEYPKTMTTLSALLITAGSIPAIAASGGTAIPALAPAMHALAAAGGGGMTAVLAGHTAQAVGAIAVGLGNWLKANQVQTQAVSDAAATAPAGESGKKK